MRDIRTITSRTLAVGAASVCIAAAGGTASLTTPALAHSGAPAAGSHSLAGQRWHYATQVDGHGGKDRVVLTALSDFRYKKYVGLMGHYAVRVKFADGGSSRVILRASYYYTNRAGSPWWGATDLDHLPGNELLVGKAGGAHTVVWTALTVRDGRLVRFAAPADSSWFSNSSLGTGSEGWKCTRHGVQARAVYPTHVNSHRYHVTRDNYRWKTGGWVHTRHYGVIVDGSVSYPPGTSHYAEFDCPGLP